MGIRKHNRTIWVLSLITFLLLIFLLAREGKLGNSVVSSPDDQRASPKTEIAAEDLFGDKVLGAFSDSNPSDGNAKIQFENVLNRLGQCFQRSSQFEVADSPVQIDTLTQFVQIESGAVTGQSDRSMSWNLKTPDGQSRNLRLKITGDGAGHIGRELQYFSVGFDGQLSPIPVAAEISSAPSDDVVNQMLKDGEVVSKERAAAVFFSSGDRIEYVERNNELSGFEMFRKGKRFQCADIRLPENCQCQ